MSEYTEQAREFLIKTNTSMKIEEVGLAANPLWKEKELRPHYRITLTTPRGTMEFDFWSSLHHAELLRTPISEYAEKRFKIPYENLTIDEKRTALKEWRQKRDEAEPTEYDILACLTKYDPGTFEDFCWNFDYNSDSISDLQIYLAVQKEYCQLMRIFTHEQMEMLQEIQ